MYSKKRLILTLLVLCFAFVSFTPLTAQELILSKVYMKDGNVFIGEITRYESGIITIKTEYGTFNLDDSKVKYITVSESELKESYKEPCIVLKDGKVIPAKVSSYISVLKRVKVSSNYGDIIIDRFKDIALIILEPVEGKPWLSGWAYRKKITIAGSVGAGTNYQVLLKIGESSGASGADFNLEGLSAKFPSGKNDGGDLRFTASDGTTLQDFWVESVSGTSPNRVAYVWVEVSADLGTNQDIYCYFRNPNATNVSNIKNTFLVGDDFDDNSIDTSIWTETDPNNRIVETNNRLEMYNPHTTNESAYDRYLKSLTSVNTNILEIVGFIDWTNPTTQEAFGGIYAYFSNESAIRLISRGTGGTLRINIMQGNTKVYDFESSISKGRLVKITYNFSNNEIKVFYDNNGTWIQLGTTQTYNLGTTAYVMLASGDQTTFSGADTIIIDDIRVRKIVSPEPAFSSAGSVEKRN